MLLTDKLLGIRMLIVDIDGVMTDGGIILGSNEVEVKRFHVRDGMGITLARTGGLLTGIITGRESESVARRARELHFDLVFQNHPQKLVALEKILAHSDITAAEILYIGDDIQDIPLMQAVGCSCAVADASPVVLEIADYRCRAVGGYGAVREVVDMLLSAQGKLEQAIIDVIGQDYRKH